jgi:hypothetical protein
MSVMRANIDLRLGDYTMHAQVVSKCLKSAL